MVAGTRVVNLKQGIWNSKECAPQQSWFGKGRFILFAWIQKFSFSFLVKSLFSDDTLLTASNITTQHYNAFSSCEVSVGHSAAPMTDGNRVDQ